ncbi:hypothetical protein GGX14DRAFT_470402 [Mycena pura]|uniref:Chromo domain-containing protein n=1 Tax=Mycena pura TaxID=153505 RepID=A0AAD6V2M5_9AGAR|nr:hypothetical protein GGX14DRAFT_470402 [Mycena pura]
MTSDLSGTTTSSRLATRTSSSANQSRSSTPPNSLSAPPSTPTNSVAIPRDALQARDARDTLLAAYAIAMPSPVRKTASRSALAAENDLLRNLLKAAGIELDKNYAQMVLMERENGNMCQQLHAKKNKPKRTYTTGKARLMTSAEMAQALLDELQKKQMAELHSELKKNVFPAIRKAISEAEKAAKAAWKKRDQEARAAAKAAEKARKAAEKQAAKVAARARGRGQVGTRGSRGRGVRGAAKGAGSRRQAQDSDNEDESSPESDSPGEEPDPIATADFESSDEESDFDEPLNSANVGLSATNTPPAMQNESDDDDESEQDETEIVTFNGHRWESRRNLEFQVVWMDGDVTWEPLANVNDCAAMEVYLAHHDLDDPLLLSKRKFLIDKAQKASNE